MALDEAIQSLADRLEELVVLYDADLKVVTFSAHDETADRARRSIILSRRASVRAADRMRRSGVSTARQPVLIPADSESGAMARVIYPVRRRERLLGFVAYLVEDSLASLASSHRQALTDAETELAELLFIRALGEQRGCRQLPETMRMLISDVSADRDAAARVLLDEGLVSHSPQYRAVVLSISPHPASRRSSHGHLLESCVAMAARATQLRAAGTMLSRQHAILVLPRLADLACLASLLRKESGSQVCAGVGASRPALSDLMGSYREAAIAARAPWADPETYGIVASWNDLGLDRVLLQVPLDSLTVDDLPATVQPLLSSSGPDLAATLERYLDTGGDAQATARLLHIHRSSLYYRLGLIRKMTGADLADGRLRRELHTALRIAILAGLRPGSKEGLRMSDPPDLRPAQPRDLRSARSDWRPVAKRDGQEDPPNARSGADGRRRRLTGANSAQR